MSNRVRYYFGRARLAGMFTRLPIAIFILLIGILLWVYAASNATPYSVFVQGYQRAYGTYVSSHYRRPPGSVNHDSPYEVLSFLGIITSLTGIVYSAWIIIRFAGETDENLLPNVTVEGIRIDQTIHISNRNAQAQKNWNCERCRFSISAGQRYWYYEVKRGTSLWIRHRFCQECFSHIKDVIEKQKLTRKEVYQKYFGFNPE
jgi:hypothetical protein